MTAADSSLLDFSTEEVIPYQQVVTLGNISVGLSHAAGGPMEAHWIQDGYSYLLQVKEGEGDSAEESFVRWVEYFVEDFAAVPSIKG